ncbi:PIN domain-like protein [Thamnidium elegans]|nr:PIN domain-like protein [Thamnidium elegans]
MTTFLFWNEQDLLTAPFFFSCSELRAMFFRFCRLYEYGIRPVFVFDGPHRPRYKRNKEIDTTPSHTKFTRDLKELIKHFHFSVWEAHGEAEAECALLERLGFVDIIFTGDSDVFLFGGRHVVRRWPKERQELLSCYDLLWIFDTTKLDRSDLILIGLLRGSDYDTHGTKGIGINSSSQLARCHLHHEIMDDIQLFGRDYKLDNERVQHLFDDLTYELHHNTCGNLKRKRTNVVLDAKFFDFSIVIDFIHPTTKIGSITSENMELAQQLEKNLSYHYEPDWLNLAEFAQVSFKWPAEYLLKRFSSVLYPGFMANKLRRQQPSFKRKRPNDEPSTQNSATLSQQEEFHQSSLMLHMKESKEDDVVKITQSKMSNNDIRLYRVEWDISTFEAFQQIVQLKLNWLDFRDIDVDLLKEVQDVDSFSSVKRQWVDANYIHYTYPSIALEYQNQQKKNNNSFLILPLKRT